MNRLQRSQTNAWPCANASDRAKKDDTESPLLSDSQDNMNSDDPQGNHLAGNQSAAPTMQLELTIPEVPANLPAQNGADVENSLPEPKIGAWFKAITVVTTVIAIMSFIGIMTRNSTERATKPALFTQQLDISVQTKSVFPPINLPDDGTIIQVGLFAQLEGAEDEQLILSRIGLEPYIQKRATEDGLFYAVLLGPLSLETHATTVAILTSNNLTYFRRPSRGF